ncbi:MAG: CehA/McbA family metallohydrolase [Turicibacter sp.]|nr:CehA/McbA family metallohydrolase [Turicibacter sp.]
MKYWVHTFLILYSLLAMYQIKPFLDESEQLVNQWIDIEQGEVTGVTQDDKGKPIIAQLRFFDVDGALVKRIQTDEEGAFKTLLDEGRYTLEVSKGYEYEIKQLAIEVQKESPLTLESISLARVMDWTAKQYISGDFHQHSQFSDDAMNTISEILKANQANGLNCGALADHNSVSGNDEWMTLAKDSKFIAIPSQEITTKQGHYLALNTTNLIDLTDLKTEDDVKKMISNIHEQGGLAQINHPGRNFSYWEQASLFDAIEIWNGQAMPPISDQTGIESSFSYNKISKEKWFELLSSGVKITALGNSDNHDISGGSTIAPISENETFNEWIADGLYNGNPRNYIRVDEVTIEGILEGIKGGHVFITNGPLMDVTINEVSFGDTLEGVTEAEISYIVASNHGELEELNIIADGDVIEKIPLASDVPTIGTLTLNLSDYHWVVFEVISKSFEYAISNPIYLK